MDRTFYVCDGEVLLLRSKYYYLRSSSSTIYIYCSMCIVVAISIQS